MAKKLVLASSSPRRAELISQLALNFDLVDVEIDETPAPHESARAFVERMALEKAQAGYTSLVSNESWVIGGDTLLSFKGQIIGKPQAYLDFTNIMNQLSGQWHDVLSAVSLVSPDKQASLVNSTRVKFKSLTVKEIESYWHTGEPLGKAGGYAIQGQGARFIEQIEGSYSAVMGLPLFELNQLLTKSGFYNE